MRRTSRPVVLLVGIDAQARDHYAHILQQTGCDVRACARASTALEMLGSEPCDLLITDSGEPPLDGVELACRARRLSNLQILIISRYAHFIQQQHETDILARDYIQLPTTTAHVISRVNACLSRLPAPPSRSWGEPFAHGPLLLHPSRHGCTWRGLSVYLNLPERTIVETVARAPGRIHTCCALMEVIHGHTDAAETTIPEHVARLRRKFQRIDRDFDALECVANAFYRWRR